MNNEIVVKINPRNPGHFFACCGLLECANRLGNAEGYFSENTFRIRTETSLNKLIPLIAKSRIVAIPEPSAADPEAGQMSLPFMLSEPFGISVNWWQMTETSAGRLKTWAGSQDSFKIIRACQFALRDVRFHTENAFNEGIVVREEPETTKTGKEKEGEKRDAFYFDSRQGDNSSALDVGFSMDALSLVKTTYPAVELLCLIGLQRCRPILVDDNEKGFEYFTWKEPLPPVLASVATAGMLDFFTDRRFQFQCTFRSKSHKRFLTATELPLGFCNQIAKG